MYKLKIKKRLNNARSHSELQNAITMGKAVVKTLHKLVEKQKLAQTAISTWGSEEEDADLQVFFRKINDVQEQWFGIQEAFVEHYEQHVAMWETILTEVKTLDPLTKSMGAAEAKLEKRRKALEKAKAKVDFETKRSQLEGDVDEAEAQLEQSIRERDTRADEISAFKKDKFAESYSAVATALTAKHDQGSAVMLEQLDACGRLDERFAATRSAVGSGHKTALSISSVPTAQASSPRSGGDPFDAGELSSSSNDGDDTGAAAAAGDDSSVAAAADSDAAAAVNSGDDLPEAPPASTPDASGVESGDGGDGGGDDAPPVRTPTDGVKQVRALYDYTAEEESDLSFKAGDIINVTGMDEDGWWFGEKDGVTGLIPSNYCSEVE